MYYMEVFITAAAREGFMSSYNMVLKREIHTKRSTPQGQTGKTNNRQTKTLKRYVT